MGSKLQLGLGDVQTGLPTEYIARQDGDKIRNRLDQSNSSKDGKGTKR